MAEAHTHNSSKSSTPLLTGGKPWIPSLIIQIFRRGTVFFLFFIDTKQNSCDFTDMVIETEINYTKTDKEKPGDVQNLVKYVQNKQG